MLLIQFAVCLLLLVVSEAEQLKTDPATQLKVATEIGQSFDTNKDGSISTHELQTGVFFRFDSNKDSRVTLSEFMVPWNANYPNQRKPGEDIFKRFDANNDGAWTAADFSALMTHVDPAHRGSVKVSTFASTLARKCVGCLLEELKSLYHVTPVFQ